MRRKNFVLTFSLFCLAEMIIFTSCNAVQESSSMAFDNANETIRYYSKKAVGTNNNQNNTVAGTEIKQSPAGNRAGIMEEDITYTGNNQQGNSNNYGAVSYPPTEVELIELGQEMKKQ